MLVQVSVRDVAVTPTKRTMSILVQSIAGLRGSSWTCCQFSVRHIPECTSHTTTDALSRRVSATLWP